MFFKQKKGNTSVAYKTESGYCFSSGNWYSSSEDENFWNTQWKGKMLFSHGSNHKGTLVLVKQGLDFEQKSVLCDPNGRFIILEAVVQDTPFLIVNIYAPNKIHEQEAFFQKIERNLDSYDFDPNSKIVIGGDFNIFLTKIWIV